MTDLEDSIRRLAAYSTMYADAKVDGIGPKGGIKRVPAPDRISGLSDGSTLLYSDLKTVLDAVERFDGVLVRALTLPVWGDVEDDLVKTYRGVNASDYESLQAVYGDILEMLAMNVVLARAALAGDDVEEAPPVAAEPVTLTAETARALARSGVGARDIGGWTVVADIEGDSGRWTQFHQLVIRDDDGRHYAAFYERGLTEYQDIAPWEDESWARFEPVQRRVKVVENVEWVKP